MNRVEEMTDEELRAEIEESERLYFEEQADTLGDLELYYAEVARRKKEKL